MTETPTSDQLPEPAAPQPPRRFRRWRSALAGVALVGLGAVGGYAAGAAHGPWWILSAAAHRFDPARMERHMDRRVDRMLDRVDATQEQRDKVNGIVKSAFGDLQALGLKPFEMREKLLTLLRADTVDPAAIETLRADQIAKADTASKRIVQAMTEAAQVLTPEQRRELADRWERHGPRWHDRDRAADGK